MSSSSDIHHIVDMIKEIRFSFLTYLEVKGVGHSSGVHSEKNRSLEAR